MKDLKKYLTAKNIVIVVAAIALLLFPTVVKSNYYVQTVLLMMLYAYWATSWNIIGGYGGQLALGNVAFVGIGAYVAVLLYIYNGITPWIGMLIGGVISGLIALLLGSICFRLKGSYYTLSTVALLYVIRLIMQTEDTIFGYKTHGAVGIRIDWAGESLLGMQFARKAPYFYIMFGLLVIGLIVSKIIRDNRMGYYLSAINTNQEAASSLGVNVMKYKQTAFFISAFLTSVGGSCYGFLLSAVDPISIFAYDLSTRIMILAVIGGRGTLWGPVLGAFILVPINEALRVNFGAQLAGLSNVFYGILLMLVVVFLPKGFAGLPEVIAKVRSKKKAAKEVVK